jgi:hypothetical protein
MIFRDSFLLVLSLRRSPNPMEGESLLLGNLIADHSPLLYPRSAPVEHSSVELSTGADKTSEVPHDLS